MRQIIILALLVGLIPSWAGAAGGHGVELLKAPINLSNTESLQRGAKYFVNYCLSCHSANYMRYNRIAEDLDLDPRLVEDNLIFTGRKIGETMTVAMTKDYAKTAFGKAPPDLSLIARSKGADWIYTYLLTFYLDESRPFGVNNLVSPNVGMPHVMWDMQGWQRLTATHDDHGDAHGEEEHGEAMEHAEEAHHGPSRITDQLELVSHGSMTPGEYQRAIKDLTNYMVYMAEPAQLVRKKVGFWVLLYLGLFLILAYLLKKEFWKDVH